MHKVNSPRGRAVHWAGPDTPADRLYRITVPATDGLQGKHAKRVRPHTFKITEARDSTESRTYGIIMSVSSVKLSATDTVYFLTREL